MMAENLMMRKPPNAEPSRSRRKLSADEAGEQRISHRHSKQKGRRLSALAFR